MSPLQNTSKTLKKSAPVTNASFSHLPSMSSPVSNPSSHPPSMSSPASNTLSTHPPSMSSFASNTLSFHPPSMSSPSKTLSSHHFKHQTISPAPNNTPSHHTAPSTHIQSGSIQEISAPTKSSTSFITSPQAQKSFPKSLPGGSPNHHFHKKKAHPYYSTNNTKYCHFCSLKPKKIEQLEEEKKGLIEELSHLQWIIDQGSFIDDGLPRSGMLPTSIGEKYKMELLGPKQNAASGVYLTLEQFLMAGEKKSPTATICYLLDCFYSREEQLGMILSGKNGKKRIVPQILSCMITYVMNASMVSVPAD